MQKSSLKWSILIWSVFLSLIISISFVSISTKINKNIKNNSINIELNENIRDIKNIINSWSFISQDLNNNESINFTSNNSPWFCSKK